MTPTPWEAIMTDDESGRPIFAISSSQNKPAWFLAKTSGWIFEHGKPLAISRTQEANAQAIVSAVNATYGQGIAPEAVAGLVEALEKFREALSDGPENCSYPMYEECEQLSRAALAKARGEK